MNAQEVAVAKLSEIKDGEMKEVAAGETKVLPARVGGKCYAAGANCTHYGAPHRWRFLKASNCTKAAA